MKTLLLILGFISVFSSALAQNTRRDEKHNKSNYLYCIGSDQSESLHQLVVDADNSYSRCSLDFSLNNSKDPQGIITRSDNFSFYKKGIPALFFFSGTHEDYHKTTDTIEKINFNILENRIKLILKVIEQLQLKGVN